MVWHGRLRTPRTNLLRRSSLMLISKRNGRLPANEPTNREMQTQRDTIVRLSGEKTRISGEAEQERALHQMRESEYLKRIAKLQQLVTERSAEVRAYEIIAEEANADCKWRSIGWLWRGNVSCLSEGGAEDFYFYKTDCAARFAEKRQEYEFLEFAIVKAVGKLSRKVDGVGLLKKALGDETPEAGGVGSSHQG
ncbi:hypothetical protein Hdeb2414_s0006g00213241 [Helianthus debilis subsp. tardiflorus]